MQFLVETKCIKKPEKNFSGLWVLLYEKRASIYEHKLFKSDYFFALLIDSINPLI